MSEKCYSSCQRTGEALCRCAVAHVVQSPNAVEWGVYCCLGDRDWVEPITITLAVCGRPPAISLSPQADGSIASLPSLHWRECVRVCVCDTSIRWCICVYVTAQKIVRGNNTVEFIPIHRERLLENSPLSSTTEGALYVFVSITDHVIGKESDGSWLDICERGCNMVTLLCCKMRWQVNSGEVNTLKASQQTALHVSMSCRRRLESLTDAIIDTYQTPGWVRPFHWGSLFASYHSWGN